MSEEFKPYPEFPPTDEEEQEAGRQILQRHEEGRRLAAKLVEHLRGEGAASTMIPVTIEGTEYQVLVVPKEMDCEQKAILLKPIRWKQYGPQPRTPARKRTAPKLVHIERKRRKSRLP